MIDKEKTDKLSVLGNIVFCLFMLPVFVLLCTFTVTVMISAHGSYERWSTRNDGMIERCRDFATMAPSLCNDMGCERPAAWGQKMELPN